MRRGLRTLASAALLLLLLFLVPGGALAQGPGRVVERGERVTGDLVVSGEDLRVLGTVEGSAVVRGGDLEVVGTVEEDAVAFGGDLTVAGEVGGDAVAFGGDLILDGGRVRGDAVAFGGNMDLRAGWIDGDAVVAGGSLRRAKGVRIGGQTVEAEGLPTFFGGRPWERWLSEGLGWGTEVRTAAAQARSPLVAFLWSLIRGAGIAFLGTAFALLLVFLLRDRAEEALTALERAPWTALGLGFVVQVLLLFLIPLLALLLTLLLVTLPLVPFLFFAWFLGYFLAFVLTGGALARLLARNAGQALDPFPALLGGGGILALGTGFFFFGGFHPLFWFCLVLPMAFLLSAWGWGAIALVLWERPTPPAKEAEAPPLFDAPPALPEEPAGEGEETPPEGEPPAPDGEEGPSADA